MALRPVCRVQFSPACFGGRTDPLIAVVMTQGQRTCLPACLCPRSNLSPTKAGCRLAVEPDVEPPLILAVADKRALHRKEGEEPIADGPAIVP